MGLVTVRRRLERLEAATGHQPPVDDDDGRSVADLVAAAAVPLEDFAARFVVVEDESASPAERARAGQWCGQVLTAGRRALVGVGT